MGHEIDLKQYQIHTDLAIESVTEDIKGVKKTIEKEDDITITDIVISNNSGSIINKLDGRYITIEFIDATDSENANKIKKVFTTKLKELLKKYDKYLIVGLGNINSTPDALGPKAIEHIIVTRHIHELNQLDETYKITSVIKPGVTSQTGIETLDTIKSITDKVNPDVVIVIDSLMSTSINRVNKTIQMTTTGIHPGSGVGNNRKEISVKTLNKPVIAIGVPTVVDATTIVADTIEYMHKHFAYMKKNIDNPISKLIPVINSSYLKENIKVSLEDKKNLLGMIGSLDEIEIKKLIYEILTPINYNLIVTPKEIDFVIDKLSNIIGLGINEALHDL